MIHSGAKGNPMNCQVYEDDNCAWCDTAGFGETKEGSWDCGSAVFALIRFLKQQKNGFHLAIFVAHRGRVTEELHSTYKVFDAMLPKETPRVLIYTRDEFDYGTDTWFSTGNAEVESETTTMNSAQPGDIQPPMTNREYLEKNGMIFSAALGVDFPRIPTNARQNDKDGAKNHIRH
ncbi:unnamed protein product, partial [Rotaria sordida]